MVLATCPSSMLIIIATTMLSEAYLPILSSILVILLLWSRGFIPFLGSSPSGHPKWGKPMGG